MMPIESNFLLKYHVSCNFMLKYYITVSLRQFTKTLNQFFDLFRTNESLEIGMPVHLYNWMNQSSFEVILLDNLLINGHYLKNTKLRFRWKLLYLGIWFLQLSPSMNKLLEKLYFGLLHALNFSCAWHKEASYCR